MTKSHLAPLRMGQVCITLQGAKFPHLTGAGGCFRARIHGTDGIYRHLASPGQLQEGAVQGRASPLDRQDKVAALFQIAQTRPESGLRWREGVLA